MLCVIVLVCLVCLEIKDVVVDLIYCCNVLILLFFVWLFIEVYLICFFKFEGFFILLLIIMFLIWGLLNY